MRPTTSIVIKILLGFTCEYLVFLSAVGQKRQKIYASVCLYIVRLPHVPSPNKYSHRSCNQHQGSNKQETLVMMITVKKRKYK